VKAVSRALVLAPSVSAAGALDASLSLVVCAYPAQQRVCSPGKRSSKSVDDPRRQVPRQTIEKLSGLRTPAVACALVGGYSERSLTVLVVGPSDEDGRFGAPTLVGSTYRCSGPRVLAALREKDRQPARAGSATKLVRTLKRDERGVLIAASAQQPTQLARRLSIAFIGSALQVDAAARFTRRACARRELRRDDERRWQLELTTHAWIIGRTPQGRH
jgi:hypothetical protein